jgi:hypothetical protein
MSVIVYMEKNSRLFFSSEGELNIQKKLVRKRSLLFFLERNKTSFTNKHRERKEWLQMEAEIHVTQLNFQSLSDKKNCLFSFSLSCWGDVFQKPRLSTVSSKLIAPSHMIVIYFMRFFVH